ncbi:MAG: serine/threonine protein kinase [Planctomycetales bacterium]
MIDDESQDDLQATLIYPPREQSAGTTRARDGGGGASMTSLALVGAVHGKGPGFEKETRDLLRKRLTIFATLFSAGFTYAMIESFVGTYVPHVEVRATVLAVCFGIAGLCWSSVRLSLSQLRVVELVLFGSIAGMTLCVMSGYILHFAGKNDAQGVIAVKYANISAFPILMLLYAILTPMTWKRAAVICFIAACLPYAVVLGTASWSPRVAEIYAADNFNFPPVPFLTALAAVFIAHQIHAFRRKEYKARRFGQYQLMEKIDAGGMGEVYRAEHRLLKRPCAIKLIRPDAETDEDALKRFEREVKATAKLTHWNSIEIFDYGHTDDGAFYYVMELLPGKSLSQLVKQHGPLPPGRAVHFLRQTCSALQEAHSHGLIHRDVKPDNIFAAERGGMHDVAKLLDFGLVKEETTQQRGDDGAEENSFLGSPLYMAPEQATAFHSVDARTDVYALGATAFFLLTGRPPFMADNAMGVIIAHACDPVVPPSEYHADVPADLEQVILQCLAKKPEDRYPDALSLKDALTACECHGDWNDQQAAAWWKNIPSTPSPLAETSGSANPGDLDDSIDPLDKTNISPPPTDA